MGRREKPKGPDPSCSKCDGEGWLWWYELDHYSGPAAETGQDDTQYSCDGCHKEEDEVDKSITVNDQLVVIRGLLKECEMLHESYENKREEAARASISWKQAEDKMMELRKQRDKFEFDYMKTKERLAKARLQLSLMMEGQPVLPIDSYLHLNCGSIMNMDGYCNKCGFHVCRLCQGNRYTCGHFVGHGAL